MKVASPSAHYKIDAEFFDYFAYPSGADADSGKRIQQAVLAAARPLESVRILDVGSGNGWLARTAHESACTVSVDLGVPNLKRLRQELGSDFLAVCADAARLPFRPGSFDRIVLSEVLEHVNWPDMVVSETARCLSPAGTAIFSTPYRERIQSSLCVHCNRPTPANAHLHSFDKARYRASLASAGLHVRKMLLIQNKALSTLRVSYILRFLPYALWRFVDAVGMILFPKANTIIVTGSKRR